VVANETHEMPPPGSTLKVGGPSSVSLFPSFYLHGRERKRLMDDTEMLFSNVKYLERCERKRQAEIDVNSFRFRPKQQGLVKVIKENRKTIRRITTTTATSTTITNNKTKGKKLLRLMLQPWLRVEATLGTYHCEIGARYIIIKVRVLLGVNVIYFGCGEKGHYRNKCPKRTNQQNKEARARAYMMGTKNPQQNPNMVTDISYEVKLANGKVVSTNTVLRGCTLALFNHVFKIDLLPTRLVRVPLPNGKILKISGERPEKNLRSLSCMKGDEKKVEDIPIICDFPEKKLNMRQRWWIELLSDYECEIKYHPGKANIVADALSRKERLKPRRVRTMSMTVHFGLKTKILEA
nr:reverse transcriptase domain-containing protein [Tanacetum cinerariifolium]